MFKERLKIVGNSCLNILLGITAFIAFCLVMFFFFLGISFVTEFLANKFDLTSEDFVSYLEICLFIIITFLSLFVLYKLFKFIHWLIIEPWIDSREEKRWAKSRNEGLLCEDCGSFIDGEAPGHPRKCDNCAEDFVRLLKEIEEHKLTNIKESE